MKRKIKSLLTIVGVLLLFVIISPLKAEAGDIVIVYGEPNGFTTQAKSMQRKYTSSASIYTCRTSDDFLNRWNWIRGNVMLLSCKGGTGGSSSVAFKLAQKSGKKVVAH